MTSDVIEFAGAAMVWRGKRNNVIASEAKQSRVRHSGAMRTRNLEIPGLVLI
jgi:hypothetical protein